MVLDSFLLFFYIYIKLICILIIRQNLCILVEQLFSYYIFLPIFNIHERTTILV